MNAPWLYEGVTMLIRGCWTVDNPLIRPQWNTKDMNLSTACHSRYYVLRMRIGLIYLGRHGPGGPISFELASHLSKHAELFAVVSQNADHIDYWRNSGLTIIEVPTFQTRFE